MAVIEYGAGVIDARGSVAGTCFSRGAAGHIMRAKTMPINPNTVLQVARRAALAYCAKYWSDQLSEQQRIDWRAYAAATTWTNKLGQSIQINGMAAFVRVNTLQRLIPSSLIDAAPTAVGHAGGVGLAFTAENDTSNLQLAEPTGSFDKDTNIHTLWIFQGHPANPGRLTTPQGFRYIARVWGSPGDPLSFPYELTSEYTMALGQRVTIKAMFQDEHYRISGPHWATAIAAPS